MDHLLVHSTNPSDFTIAWGMHVYIYYKNLLDVCKNESLKIMYHMEVLDFLVHVSISWTFICVRIFEIHVDVIGRGHHILEGVNLDPRELFYIQNMSYWYQLKLLMVSIHVHFLIYIFVFISKQIFIVSNVIFSFVVGIIDFFFIVRFIKRWGMITQEG